MNRYIVWKEPNEGDIVKADTFRMATCDVVQFIVNTPVGGTNPPRIVAQYNLTKIVGFHELDSDEDK